MPKVLQAVLGHIFLYSGSSGSEGFAAGLLLGREVPGKCIADTRFAPISPQAAAPAVPWAVPSVPRAASAKEPQTSAAVVPDVGESLLPGINGGTWANLHFIQL